MAYGLAIWQSEREREERRYGIGVGRDSHFRGVDEKNNALCSGELEPSCSMALGRARLPGL